MTIQAAHGQILVDVLDEIRALHAELAQFQRSSPPMMDFDCPLAFRHKKGEYIFEHLQRILFSGGDFFVTGACGD